jgi:hypothetical protein
MTAICSSCNVFTGSLRAVFTHIQRDQDHKLQREKRDRIKCQQRKPFLPCHAFCIVSVCYQGTKSFPLVQEIIRHRWGSRPPDDCWLWCAQYCNEHYTQPQNAFLHLHYMKSSLRLAKKKNLWDKSNGNTDWAEFHILPIWLSRFHLSTIINKLIRK